MSQLRADEIEHRRGLVLGLTLAEVLLLFLFVLLVGLSWRLLGLQKDVAAQRATAVEAKEQAVKAQKDLLDFQSQLVALTPLLEEVRKAGGLDIATAQQLVERLARTDALENEVATLRASNARLASQLKSVERIASDVGRFRSFERAIEVAARIDPNDPPAALLRAAEVLVRLGAETRPDEVKPFSEMTADQQAVARLNQVEQERDQALRQRDYLMRRGPGNGLTYPPCWFAADGSAEFMFDIEIRDKGLTIREGTPHRAGHPDLRLVQTVPLDTLIADSAFRDGTKSLAGWTKEKNCKFYSIVRDGTGPTSKARYKKALSLVQDRFYISLRGPRPSAPMIAAEPRAAAAAPPAEGGPFAPLTISPR